MNRLIVKAAFLIVAGLAVSLVASCGVGGGGHPEGDSDEVLERMDGVVDEVVEATSYEYSSVGTPSIYVCHPDLAPLEGTFKVHRRYYLEFDSGSYEDAVDNVADELRSLGVDMVDEEDRLRSLGVDSDGWKYTVFRNMNTTDLVLTLRIDSICYSDVNA